MNLTSKQIIYLILAIAGAIGTWTFNLQMESPSQFFVAAWATPLSSSLMTDLLVAVITYYVFMFPEGRHLSINIWLLIVLAVLTFAIAFAFTFPLFMFFRERALLRQKSASITHSI